MTKETSSMSVTQVVLISAFLVMLPGAQAQTGVITTYAGTGSSTFSGDGGPATSAGVWPFLMAADASGNLFITDGARVRRVDAATGIITTVAGGGTGGDGGPATSAAL